MPALDDTPITVGELNRRARLAVETAFPLVWVAGELTGLTRAPSGHWYFTLRDQEASVRCAMFRNRNQFLDWQPANGEHVEARAQPTLYEARGEFQLTVEILRRAGLGSLYEALARLKARLEKEGLFDPGRKRTPPARPRGIGVITSPQAAALRDVLITLGRRWPLAPVYLFPTPVQGEAAAQSIAQALARAAASGHCDVILLVRGGGDARDLWAFNEEIVARAVAASPVPVICGVGHETDVTLADFAADLRAPTPTGAAQFATPDRDVLLAEVDRHARHLTRRMRGRLERLAQALDVTTARLRHPAESLGRQRAQVVQYRRRLALAQGHRLDQAGLHLRLLESRLRAVRPRPESARQSVEHLAGQLAERLRDRLERRRERLEGWIARLAQLNPAAVLARGYGIVRDGQGRVVSDSARLAAGDRLAITLHRGGFNARVEGDDPQ